MKKIVVGTIAFLVIVSLFLDTSYDNSPKKLRCSHSQYITSHQTYIKNLNLLKEAQQLFKNDKTVFSYKIFYPKYSKSTLKIFLDLASLNDIVLKGRETLFKDQTVNKQRVVKVEVTVRENDREDPNKKSSFCSINAGSLDININYKGQEVYRGYSEFLRGNRENIDKTLQCIFNSFSNL